MLSDPRLAKVLVGVVDCSLRGSDYAVEAWHILRKCLLADRSPTLYELGRLEELFSAALDDIKGPQLRVDLSLDRLYG
jgi:hypothetical protein